MKTINNEAILDIIYDLADEAGMKIDEFIAKIEEQFGASTALPEGLPADIEAELLESRSSKREQKKRARAEADDAEIRAQIKEFREMFPEVDPESIPQAVWDEVASGVSPTHAYALYLIREDRASKRASSVNERNSAQGAAAASDGSTEPVFSKEQVEKMNGKDIKNNYKGIIKAMKGWRF